MYLIVMSVRSMSEKIQYIYGPVVSFILGGLIANGVYSGLYLVLT